MSCARLVARRRWRLKWTALVALLVVVCGAPGRGQPVPPPIAREFRAAWVSPTEGGDWPSRPGLDVATQRAELLALLDGAQTDGLNAVLLHVRTAGDALYPSRTMPWSRYLVGRDGPSVPDSYAGYDPLAVAVREAHARGIQLHVWFNPFRAMPPDKLGAPGAGHVTRVHPEWVRRYGSATWIDPGIPAARRAVLDAILDVVDRYDVDGVHLDDYFYPYLEAQRVTRTVRRGKKRVRITRTVTLRFPDDASWKRYGVAKGWTNRADWRRANVDDFVRTLYREVKAHRRAVLVGISPFGIWRPGHPAGITGLDAYTETFADARKWLREGWVDYLAPQLYWPLDGRQQRFTQLDAWWRAQNVLDRHVWPGLFTMRVGSRDDPWPATEIAAEIDALRSARVGTVESLGHIHFRMRTLALLVSDTTTLGGALRRDRYADPVLPPAAPWLGDARPAAPSLSAADELSVVAQGDTGVALRREVAGPLRLRLAAGDSVAVRWWVVQTLGADDRWATRVIPSAGAETTDVAVIGAGSRWVAVRGISPTGVEGPVSMWEVR